MEKFTRMPGQNLVHSKNRTLDLGVNTPRFNVLGITHRFLQCTAPPKSHRKWHWWLSEIKGLTFPNLLAATISVIYLNFGNKTSPLHLKAHVEWCITLFYLIFCVVYPVIFPKKSITCCPEFWIPHHNKGGVYICGQICLMIWGAWNYMNKNIWVPTRFKQ